MAKRKRKLALMHTPVGMKVPELKRPGSGMRHTSHRDLKIVLVTGDMTLADTTVRATQAIDATTFVAQDPLMGLALCARHMPQMMLLDTAVPISGTRMHEVLGVALATSAPRVVLLATTAPDPADAHVPTIVWTPRMGMLLTQIEDLLNPE